MKIYYSVENGGDGSAYPKFMESEALAEWDQENMDEGWGETCTGFIELQSDSPITIVTNVSNKYDILLDLLEAESELVSNFVDQFFPEGRPVFDVGEPKDGGKDYSYYPILVNGEAVGKLFRKVESKEKILKELNNETL